LRIVLGMNILKFLSGILSIPFSKSNPSVDSVELKVFEENVFECDRFILKEEFVKLLTARNTPLYKYISFLKKRDVMIEEVEKKIDIHGLIESDSEDEDAEVNSDSEVEQDIDSNNEEIKKDELELDNIAVDDSKIENGLIYRDTIRQRNVSPSRNQIEPNQKPDSNDTFEIPLDYDDKMYGITLSRSLIASYQLLKDLCATDALLFTRILLNKKKDVKNTAIQFTNLEKDFEEARQFTMKINVALNTSKQLMRTVLKLENMPEDFKNACLQLDNILNELDMHYLSKLSELGNDNQLPKTKEIERIVDESESGSDWGTKPSKTIKNTVNGRK
jgi:hypothetical protein